MGCFRIDMNNHTRQYMLDICGRMDRLTVYSANGCTVDRYVYRSSKIVTDTAFLFECGRMKTIKEIADHYSTNIYYRAGKLTTKRIVTLTILPVSVVALRSQKNAYLIIDDELWMDGCRMDGYSDALQFDLVNDYPYDITDDPSEAGRLFVSSIIESSIATYKASSADMVRYSNIDELMSRKETELRARYESMIRHDLSEYREDIELKCAEAAESKKQAESNYNKYIEYARQLGIDTTEYRLESI